MLKTRCLKMKGDPHDGLDLDELKEKVEMQLESHKIAARDQITQLNKQVCHLSAVAFLLQMFCDLFSAVEVGK